jgi:hypothetical protein
VQEQLMGRKYDISLRGVDNALCALLESCLKLDAKNISMEIKGGDRATDKRNDICRLGGEFVRQFLVVGDQVGDIDVAVVLLYKDILT